MNGIAGDYGLQGELVCPAGMPIRAGLFADDVAVELDRGYSD